MSSGGTPAHTDTDTHMQINNKSYFARKKSSLENKSSIVKKYLVLRQLFPKRRNVQEPNGWRPDGRLLQLWHTTAPELLQTSSKIEPTVKLA